MSEITVSPGSARARFYCAVKKTKWGRKGKCRARKVEVRRKKRKERVEKVELRKTEREK